MVNNSTNTNNQNRKLKVLVAEDNEMNREVIKAFLEIKELEIYMVTNGYEAISMLEKTEIDFIIMDVQMPEMDGLEATKIIRDKGYKLPIIAVTAYAMSENEKECINAGVDYYISKPINYNFLFEIINKINHKLLI